MNHAAWWLSDSYAVDSAVPPQINDEHLQGPVGLALVRVYDQGKTDPGWNESAFMDNYLKRRFASVPAMYLYNRKRLPFAYVMRSVKLVCLDIDGKNGGFVHNEILGVPMPRTLAETSKSGNGYHLFYYVEDDWDPAKGYARYVDRIGLEQGVDFRGTGCIYHHSTQRWNDRTIAPLPTLLSKKLLVAAERRLRAKEEIKELMMTGDKDDILTAQATAIEELKQAKPNDGARNNTLFAIGADLFKLGVENWEELIEDKATDLGLPDPEIDKLLQNIPKYAGS